VDRGHANRRQFLEKSLAAAGFVGGGLLVRPSAAHQKAKRAVERIGIGAIGLRYQGSVITRKAVTHGDVAALCDVDRQVLDKAGKEFGSSARRFEDYRDLVQREDVDVVMIGTPDHWHTKMVIDACRAGKDVYCEKPLTLTVDEGKVLRRVVEQTGRVVQVGSWQRSDHRFRLAVEMVRQGRLGELQRVDVVLGKNKTGGPFQVQPVPDHFNWERWQGQTPTVPYIPERSHYTFRWWYEYSGGQMTDWGAHHVDVAQWGIGAEPLEIEGRAKYPTIENGYNVAIDYQARYRYPRGVEMTIRDHGRNGVMFTGSEGRIFVNRGTLDGKPVERLSKDPLPREHFVAYKSDNLSRPQRAGKLDAIINHMGNFFDCVESRTRPISDVDSQHRSVSTCHLGNIAMRLGRPLRWNSKSEQFVDDAEADKLLAREQRAGYEIG